MTDPTRFDLDEHQRALLAEMGIRVWWPQSEADRGGQAVTPSVAASTTASVATPVVGANHAPVARPAATTPRAPAPVRAVSHVSNSAPSAAFEGVPLPDHVPQMDWETLQATVSQCRACGLCASRTNTVFGVGDRQAQWMVIGEAPGENEDLQGQPFVGQAGKLLDNMLKAVGLNRTVQGQKDGQAGVYITNTLKCRPPGNRNPEPLELQTCAPYLVRQVALVRPRIILAMGRFAVQSLLQSSEPIGKLRGRVHDYQGVPVVVTYHPAYLLRNPADKAKAWADLCLAMQTVQPD